jgi:uncharacterized pyridoxal phosphate-containing UPF0001 family protein
LTTARPEDRESTDADRYLERVGQGLSIVRRRIGDAGGDPDRITIVAVTKTFGVAAVRAALANGLADVGENYAAELVAKAGELQATSPGGVGAPQPRWHYLGRIQRRKVRDLSPVVALWQGLSREVEAEAIARHAGTGAATGGAGGARPKVLVEVDMTGIEGRSGVDPDEVAPLVAAARAAGVDVAGLMTIGPPGGGQAAMQAFRAVAGLADELGLAVRSMGMSGDLEQAVLAGTTMVRVGEALFGPRPALPHLAQ